RGAVHHLPPPAVVPRAGEPVAPERDGRVELLLRLEMRACTWSDIAAEFVEGEHGGLALDQLESRLHVGAVGLERLGGVQAERQRRGVEQRLPVQQLHRVRLGAVAEAWSDGRAERERPAYAGDP